MHPLADDSSTPAGRKAHRDILRPDRRGITLKGGLLLSQGLPPGV
ncbi:hypothetical protein [Streptomyces violaceusniger]|nr:hypothetical protein [Streptomyces violaceusniger]